MSRRRLAAVLLTPWFVLGAVACSPSSPAPGGGTAPSAGASARTVQITLAADGSVTPSGERIDLAVGEPLTLEVRGERDDEVHVHGVDEEIEVDAGETETETVTFDTPGSYEVESHDPARIILIVNVR